MIDLEDLEDNDIGLCNTACVGFAPYKGKIRYINKWYDNIADINDTQECYDVILEELPEKPQMKLILYDKEIIIEYDKTNEATALQQTIDIIKRPDQLIGMDYADIYSYFSAKVTFLTSTLDGNTEEEYLAAAKKWFDQIDRDYNIKNGGLILLTGQATMFLISDIASYYDKKINNDDIMILLQLFGDENWDTGVQISLWLFC